ncbi:MAG TPA: hypothetical protein VKX28_07485 [Xanthobacteraceae bacterium]|nr:hypothetical protein [Xanthobacteraceae bacterium]
MANDEPGSVEGVDPQPRRRVPPPTIDVEAKDVSALPHADQTASGASPSADPKRSGRRWPLVAAAVLGAVIAFALAAGAWVLLGGNLARPVAQRVEDNGETNARLTRIETQLAALAHAAPAPSEPKLPDEVTQRLARIEATLTQQSSAVDRQIKPLADRLADIDSRDQEAAAAAQIARQRADAAAKSLADVAQQLAQLNAERARAPQVERADLDALAARLASLESTTKAIGEQLAHMNSTSGAASGDARQAVLAIALKDAVDRGTPYAGELDAMRPFADAGAISALEPFAKSGVPSAAALAHDAVALVPALVTAADISRPEGVWSRLWVNAKRMIRLRPVGNVPGNEADAVIARLELKASRNDIDGVLAEAGNLPAPARGPIAPWVARVQARNAALAAAGRLATASLDHLGRNAAQGTPDR